MQVSWTEGTFTPPVPEAYGWLKGMSFPEDRPLLNVSQAAPVSPPPAPMRAAMAAMIEEPGIHCYGPDLGLPDLRAEVAARFSRLYRGIIRPDQVAITSGCNQAFAATIHALCGAGDEVILPTPWYFNHKMWLDMAGVAAVPLRTGPDMCPDPDAARALITPRTRAIALVSPNNPAGVEYPPEILAAFAQLCRHAGIRLILDETYRDFHSAEDPLHGLFDDGWDEVLVQLYSFSKSYHLAGHRVGTLIAAPAFMSEVEKFIDTVTICPSQLGQRAALWGMRHLDNWLAEERSEILRRRAAIEAGIAQLAPQGWQLLGTGGYFAYVRHAFDGNSHDLAHRLLERQSVLLLPGTMFRPEGDPRGAKEFRIAYANVDRGGIDTLITRLAAFTG